MGDEVTVTLEPGDDDDKTEDIVEEVVEEIEEKSSEADLKIILEHLDKLGDRIVEAYQTETDSIREAFAHQTEAISEHMTTLSENSNPEPTPDPIPEPVEEIKEEVESEASTKVDEETGDVVPDLPKEEVEEPSSKVELPEDVVPNRKLKWRAVLLGGSGGSGGKRK